MSCCGKQRQQFRMEPAFLPPLQPNSGIYFRYLGENSITVVGPATGRKYDFPVSGTTAAADPRDAPSMATVPFMVQVSRPY